MRAVQTQISLQIAFYQALHHLEWYGTKWVANSVDPDQSPRSPHNATVSIFLCNFLGCEIFVLFAHVLTSTCDTHIHMLLLRKGSTVRICTASVTYSYVWNMLTHKALLKSKRQMVAFSIILVIVESWSIELLPFLKTVLFVTNNTVCWCHSNSILSKIKQYIYKPSVWSHESNVDDFEIGWICPPFHISGMISASKHLLNKTVNFVYKSKGVPAF